jgi:hypothetical protein
MRKLSKITIMVGIALTIMIMVQPVFAACTSVRGVSTTYIYGGSANTPTYYADAAFWALGSGDPVVGAGNDSGSLGYGLFAVVPNTYGYISTHWGTPGVDGCIDATTAPVPCNTAGCCTAILISDSDTVTDQGYFLFMTIQADNFANYVGGSATMAPVPKPNITASTRVGTTGVNVTVRCPLQAEVAAGLALDPGCNDTVLTGCRTYAQAVARGASPPATRDLSAWAAVGSGAAAGGTEILPLTCAGEEDLYVTQSLVFDSGYELAFGGENSTRVECGPNVANPTRRLQEATPTHRKSGRTR